MATADLQTWRHILLLVAAFLVSFWVVAEAAEDTNHVYNPCGNARIQKRDGFTFAIIFNNNRSDFYHNGVQLSPCDRRLNLYSGRIALFRPEVDKLSILTINTSTISPEYYGYMVAYAGSKPAAISTPRYVADSNYIVTSFSLVFNFNNGRLSNMLWKNDNCKRCSGGDTSFVCLTKTGDCAVPISSCKHRGGKVDCSLSIQLAFSGVDKSYEVLNSWYQFDNLHQYSLYGLYKNLKDSLTSEYNKWF